MSMTKRYIESLPADEQNAILGEFTEAERGEERRYDADDKPDWSHDHRCRMCGNQWHCSDAKCGIYFEPMGCGLNGCGGRHDEWTDSAENEPMCQCGHSRAIHTSSGCDSLYCRCNGFAIENEPTDEESAEWAQALIEEEDEEANDPLVKCRICRKTWPISEMNTNGECPDCQLEEWEQRDAALMIKPEGKCVTLADNNGIEWKL